MLNFFATGILELNEAIPVNKAWYLTSQLPSEMIMLRMCSLSTEI